MKMSVGCNCCAPAVCGLVHVGVSACSSFLNGTTVTLSKSAVATLNLVSGGTGYTNGTDKSLSFTGGGGSGAAGLYDVVGGMIGNLRLTAGGTGYTSAPTVGFIGAGSGTGASATATIATTTVATGTTSGEVISVTRTAGGTGYTNGTFAGTFTGGGGTGATFSFVVSGGVVQSTLTMTAFGSGYTSVPTPDFSAAGAGTGATATAAIRPRAALGIPAAGTYSAAASSPGTGLDAASGSISATCSNTANVLTITASPQSGYFCCADCGGIAFPSTLYLTDDNTSCTLSYAGTIGTTIEWRGCYTYSSTILDRYLTAPSCEQCQSSSGTVAVEYQFYCQNGIIKMTMSWLGIVCTPACPTAGTTVYGLANSLLGSGCSVGYDPPAGSDGSAALQACSFLNVVPSSKSCSPFQATWHFSGPTNSNGYPIPAPSLNATVTF